MSWNCLGSHLKVIVRRKIDANSHTRRRDSVQLNSISIGFSNNVSNWHLQTANSCLAVFVIRALFVNRIINCKHLLGKHQRYSRFQSYQINSHENATRVRKYDLMIELRLNDTVNWISQNLFDSTFQPKRNKKHRRTNILIKTRFI